jgi:hypothetical protein
MDEYESLSHTKWDCKYHVVIEEGHLLPDHVHMRSVACLYAEARDCVCTLDWLKPGKDPFQSFKRQYGTRHLA